jgi:hypothetical protein
VLFRSFGPFLLWRLASAPIWGSGRVPPDVLEWGMLAGVLPFAFGLVALGTGLRPHRSPRLGALLGAALYVGVGLGHTLYTLLDLGVSVLQITTAFVDVGGLLRWVLLWPLWLGLRFGLLALDLVTPSWTYAA